MVSVAASKSIADSMIQILCGRISEMPKLSIACINSDNVTTVAGEKGARNSKICTDARLEPLELFA
jgi:hypothetical protein